eukprot:UN29650
MVMAVKTTPLHLSLIKIILVYFGYSFTNTSCENHDSDVCQLCDPGFELVGTECQYINACLNNPCGVNANCTDIVGGLDDISGRTCDCMLGYEGNPDTGCTMIYEWIITEDYLNTDCLTDCGLDEDTETRTVECFGSDGTKSSDMCDMNTQPDTSRLCPGT